MTTRPKLQEKKLEGDELELVVEEIADLDIPPDQRDVVRGGSGTPNPGAPLARGAVGAMNC